MTDVDFTRLSADGTQLELLTRDLCTALGYRSAWSGKGPDGGSDLIVQEPTSADFGAFPRKWMVSCKDKATSGGSVGYADVGDVPGRLAQHGCQGFLLVTTTQPSSGPIDAFKAWETTMPYLFHYWDAPTIRRLLLRDAAASVAQVYFGAGGARESAEGANEPPELSIVEHASVADGSGMTLSFA
jgi:hypothetical protein